LPFNIHYIICIIASLIQAFPIIQDLDDIVLVVIAVCYGTALFLFHNLSVRLISEASSISNLLFTIQHHAGYESGIG
jgi:hypothetical protein